MYYDLIVLLVLLLVLVLVYRSFYSFVYGVAIIDIFLRVVSFLKNHLGISEFKVWADKYIGSSIEGIIKGYTSGTVEGILMWIYVIIYVFFLFYTVKYFWKKVK